MNLILKIFDAVQDWVGETMTATPTQARRWTFETPDGICEGCGGVLRRVEENGIEICRGCGEVYCIQRQGNGDENPAKNPDNPVNPF